VPLPLAWRAGDWLTPPFSSILLALNRFYGLYESTPQLHASGPRVLATKLPSYRSCGCLRLFNPFAGANDRLVVSTGLSNKIITEHTLSFQGELPWKDTPPHHIILKVTFLKKN
jgi:hypothetical protein